MKIPQPRSVSEIVKQFYGVISRPVQYASLFYTYYYLVEVENIRELRRDFEKIRDELWVAFYNYGIYSVGRELQQHVYGELRLETQFIDMTPEEAVSKMEKYLITVYPKMSVSECNKTLDLYEFFYQQFRQAGPIIITKDFEAIKKFCVGTDKFTSMFSRPTMFLQLAYNLFNLPHIEDDFYGWMREYGGEPWAKICKTLLRRRNTKPTIFVDACWNIQHNTGVWMNKVDLIGARESLNDLAEILDANANVNIEGNMFNVFKYATEYDSSLYDYERYFK